jgi:hypothetical protein
VTASYHVVLSEGQLPGIQVRDVFQRSCRVGSFTQTYNRRAGPWLPGNFIIDRGGSYVKPECPYYCGTGGTYEDMTTGSYVIEDVPDGDTRWDRQIHLFCRGGMQVTRLLDTAYGPSNNIADLALYLLRKTSRTPEALIDLDSFEDAAEFTDNLGLWFNGELNESSNLEDFLAAHGRDFMLTKTRRGGKIGLRPLLPVTTDNEIDVEPIVPVYRFTENHIIPGSFEIGWVPLADRKPFVALMLWRQQPTDDIGIIRTTEVRYAGTAPDGPFEQHDLSVFCASENHAVKAGAYRIAKRRYVSHTLRIKVRPGSFNTTLAQGDVVRVLLQRVASSAPAGVHDYLYEVDRIGKARTGEISLDLIHFPIDALGRSLVALDVMAAVGGGVLLSTGKSGTSCDVNADDDETVPADDSLDPDDWTLPDDDAFDVEILDSDFGSGWDLDGGSSGSEGDNPPEELDEQDPPPSHPTSPTGEEARTGVGLDPLAGGPASGCDDCVPTEIRWYRNGELIATIDYPGGEARVSAAGYEFGSSQKVPAWLGGIGAGVLLVPDGEDGETYTSEVDCADGCSFRNQTTIGAGSLVSSFAVHYVETILGVDTPSTWSFTASEPPFLQIFSGPFYQITARRSTDNTLQTVRSTFNELKDLRAERLEVES